MQAAITNKLKQLTLVIGLTLTALCLQLTLAPKAHATTYDVSQFTDPTGCGFVEAIAAINATPVPGATCATASAPNTVNIAAGIYTIPPGAPQLQIGTDGDLTISGAGPDKTIFDGNGNNGLFKISSYGSNNNYVFSSLALKNFVLDGNYGIELDNKIQSLKIDKIAAYGNNCISSYFCSSFYLGRGDVSANVIISNSSFFENNAGYNGLIIGGIEKCPEVSSPIVISVVNNTFYKTGSPGYVYLCGQEKSTINFINNTITNNNDFGFPGQGILRVSYDGAEPNFFMQNNILDGNISTSNYGSGDGQFAGPNGIALDSSGNIYVADVGNNRIQIFNSSGAYQSQFGTYGNGDGQFSNPYSIALDSSGNIYVADTGNNRIQVFNSSGVYQSQFGSYGGGNGEFSYPQGITLDSSGNIYVADSSNNRIQVFNSSGAYQSQFGTNGSGDGEFNYPQGIALDSSGNIYVADTQNNRIQKFDNSGVYQSQFGTSGDGDGQFNQPHGIVLDSSDDIYAVDTYNNRIQKFNSSGVYQSQFGTIGNNDGQLFSPKGIALDSSGNIYVTDTNNQRIEIFDSYGVFTNQIPNVEIKPNNCLTSDPNLATPTSLGGNISSDDTCTPYFTAPNDKNNTDPQLGSLTSEYPFVMPIAKTSPAFNNGIASGAPSTDERGVARPQYGAFDSGAYELADPANTGNLASTGFDMKIPAIVASILALSGIAVAGYSLKRR